MFFKRPQLCETILFTYTDMYISITRQCLSESVKGIGSTIFKQPFKQFQTQEWGGGLQQLCEELPLSLDGVDDDQGGEKVANIRQAIAAQWARTIDMARSHGPESIIIKERVSEMNTILQGLMKDYAQVLSFAPDPDLSTAAGPTVMENEKVGSPSESSTTESPSSENQVPFDFKFLQVGDDVWTVLQVGGLKIEGLCSIKEL